MFEHEYYQGLCAAASKGEASGEQLADLQSHVADCRECRRTYFELVDVHALMASAISSDVRLDSEELAGAVDSEQLTIRFFNKAREQGIAIPAQMIVRNERPSKSPILKKTSASLLLSFAVAAAIVVAVSGFYLASKRQSAIVALQSQLGKKDTAQIERESSLRAELAGLKDQNQDLLAGERQLQSRLDQSSLDLRTMESASLKFSQDRTNLDSLLRTKESEIATLERQVDDSRSEALSLRSELDKTRTVAAAGQSLLAGSELHTRELDKQLADKSAALSRAQELLSEGRDIREVMAARNLHIVDVFDTDVKGKTRKAFGRIFVTEGKSLIFYAYDLNDARVQDAGYHYRVWGKKEGSIESAKNLGIFFSDNKAQRRWVFECDDPKILQEIDSVFVTVEPPGVKDTDQPKGEKLMYAYLKGQANHP